MSDFVYSIGYAAFDIDSFIKVLKEFNISCLIDVRSNPVASEFHQNYSKIYLEPLLNKNGIIYRNYINEFGARQTNIEYYKKYGYLDFEEFILSDNFMSGINKVKKGLDLNYKFVLMCAEKDPLFCHRSIMVSRGFKQFGINVKHILSDYTIQTQNDIEQRLLDLYFPNRLQQNLFETKTEEEYLNEAYRIQNSKIGYKKDRIVA